MHSPDKLLHLRHTALVNQITIVRLAEGDLVVDRGHHHLADFYRVVGLAEDPAQFDPGDLGKHISARDHTFGHHITAGVVNEHVHKAPDGLQGHKDVYAFLFGLYQCRVKLLIHMTQPGADDDDATVTVVDHCIHDVRFHAGIIIEHGHFIAEVREDAHNTIAPALVVAFVDGGDLFPAYHGHRHIANGSESGTIG